jgi:hypothetical protein
MEPSVAAGKPSAHSASSSGRSAECQLPAPKQPLPSIVTLRMWRDR